MRVLASLFLFTAMGFAQVGPAPVDSGRTYVASAYGSYTSYVSKGGSTALIVAPAAVVASDGNLFVPFTSDTPVTIDRTASNAETVTPTATNCYPGSITCTLTASYSHAHITGETVTSGTFGLQEAINVALAAGSGTVLIDASWQGASGSSLITAATGSTAVVIQDNRSGTPQYYKWNGSAYVFVASGGGGGDIQATDQMLKGDNAGNAVEAIAGTDFISPNSDGGLNAHGIAAPGANQNSYTWEQVGDVCTDGSSDCAPTEVVYGQQVIVNTGLNPNSLLNFNCTGPGAPASCGADFNYTVSSTNNLPAGNKSTALASALNVWQNMPGLMAQYFGAKGDAFSPANGLSTTSGSAVVGCPDGCFLSTDVGKHVWVPGAGAAGVAFGAMITAYTNSSTVTVSATATATISNAARSVYGTDDTAAINACLLYSSQNSVQCWLRPFAAPSGQNGIVGFLVDSGSLILPENNAYEENSGAKLVGTSQSAGTNLFVEYNGDGMSLAAGPIQGATVADVDFQMDPTQPNSRGIHLNPQPGAFTNGPFTNSNFIHVNVDNPALEGIWFDGGGGPGYAFNLPNQYVQLEQFWVSGPNQSHPAALIKMTGQAAQIVFINGQVNGQGWNNTSAPNYPNPLISITEKTSGLGDTPVDVKFFGYTMEVCTKALYVGNGASNIHYDNSYIENCSSPAQYVGAVANTFNGNHIANSGNITGVVQFSSHSGGSVRDNLVYGGIAPPASLGVCDGTDQVDFGPNNIASGNTTTTDCVTATASTSSNSLTISNATTASVTAVGGAIDTIVAPYVSPGKTLTLYTSGGMQLATGGNISLGGATSPLTVAASGTVTLTLLDSGVTWLVTSGASSGGGSATPNWSTIVHGANTDPGAFSTNGNWSYHQSAYFDSNSGSQFFAFGPASTPGSDCTHIFDDGNFHIDATACGNNHGLFFKGQFSTQYIAGFQNGSSGTEQAEIGLDGTYITLGGVKYPTYTVSGLPSVPGAGKAVVVTDAAISVAGSCVGGGSNSVVAVSNGTSWMCQVPGVIPVCSGQITLGVTLITSGAAATTIPTTCTGLLSTDNIQLDFAVSPIGVTGYTNSASGMLSIIKWPATNTLNVSVYNNTAANITPGAMTLNYHVTR